MIRSIRLQHFRSYDDASFDFSSSVNIIVGPNGSGKTNLLEGILVSSLGGSYRVKDAELIQFDKPWTRLDAITDDEERTVKIIVEPKVSKGYDINGKHFQRLSLLYTIPLVLFEPNHLLLLSGSPEARRSYLDDILEQIEPGYGTLRRQYKRTLAQRNALLKKGRAIAEVQLFAWNVRLSELGASIARRRARLVEAISQDLPQLYRDLAQVQTSVTIEYHSQFALTHYETQLLHKLETNFETDLARGFTTAGPHREDISVLFNSRLATESASRGEVRTVVLALKIIELQTIESLRYKTPLLLLDDVFSELDEARRKSLTSFLGQYQTFITTTDADIIVDHFDASCNVIALKQIKY